MNEDLQFDKVRSVLSSDMNVRTVFGEIAGKIFSFKHVVASWTEGPASREYIISALARNYLGLDCAHCGAQAAYDPSAGEKLCTDCERGA